VRLRILRWPSRPAKSLSRSNGWRSYMWELVNTATRHSYFLSVLDDLLSRPYSECSYNSSQNLARIRAWMRIAHFAVVSSLNDDVHFSLMCLSLNYRSLFCVRSRPFCTRTAANPTVHVVRSRRCEDISWFCSRRLVQFNRVVRTILKLNNRSYPLFLLVKCPERRCLGPLVSEMPRPYYRYVVDHSVFCRASCSESSTSPAGHWSKLMCRGQHGDQEQR
jgi:hypothetical protein